MSKLENIKKLYEELFKEIEEEETKKDIVVIEDDVLDNIIKDKPSSLRRRNKVFNNKKPNQSGIIESIEKLIKILDNDSPTKDINSIDKTYDIVNIGENDCKSQIIKENKHKNNLISEDSMLEICSDAVVEDLRLTEESKNRKRVDVKSVKDKSSILNESDDDAINRISNMMFENGELAESNTITPFNDSNKTSILESGVMGGDYGRWKPATDAVGKSGPSLVSAIEKEQDCKYKISKDGMAQSAEGGSELWFEIEPEDPKMIIYYLGIKYKKGKDDGIKWDVLLKKGAGLGSATSVNSRTNVDTSDLDTSINSLKGDLK